MASNGLRQRLELIAFVRSGAHEAAEADYILNEHFTGADEGSELGLVADGVERAQFAEWRVLINGETAATRAELLGRRTG
ncbi:MULTISPECIES: hypothetical protein [Brevibacterium]|uniref:hypothetical protein n=1 Tax=Brevibacterium TaxID=1696 RepID=UPI000DE8BDF3|nr:MULTISPECIES: hypothetical protein [Brevibacterium]